MKHLLPVCFFLLTAALYGQNCSPERGLPVATDAVTLTPFSTYATGIFDEGAAEIVAYDAGTQRIVFTNADANAVTIVDISDPNNPTLVTEVSPMTPDLGGVNSVAVFDGLIAAAFEGDEVDDSGQVVFLDMNGVELNRVTVGVLPDMVTFNEDGTLVLTANEGEPNDDYDIDPEGSVSVIDLSGGVAAATVTTVGFTDFNPNRAALIAAGVRIFGPGATVAQDLEPEYVVVDGNTAYVSLQENNAFAVLDLTTLTFTDLIPFGFKDHSCPANAIDASNRDDAINISVQPTLGMYQPDAVALYSTGGQTYIVTANEGDARDYDGFSEEVRVKDLTLDPTAFPDRDSLQEDEALGRLRVTDALGDTDGDGDFDQLYSYGARSFSIFTTNGTLVFDSGTDFERITAAAFPDDFNSGNDENDDFDSRSDDKGPEPEAVEIFSIGGRTYALIGLERIGGIMVYDITNPADATFVSYANNRDFSVDATIEDANGNDIPNPAVGDLGTEDLIFIPATDSPTGADMVISANEISGTITFFNVGADAGAAVSLRLIHNNDGESKLIADTLMDGRAFGGAARFTAVVDSLRNQSIPTLTVSSGDNFLPGPSFNAGLNRPDGSPLYDSEVLNAIGYDAIVIGNHDFDFGPDVLQRLIEETAASMATYLSANLDFTAEPGLQMLVDNGRIAARTTVTVDGLPVGLIGLTTPDLPTVSSPRGVTVDDNLVGIAQTQVDALLAEGTNRIILISHLQSINAEIELAGQLRGVDVIVAGGGDELLTNDPANALGGLSVDGEYPIDTTDADGNRVYVVTTPGEYRYVGNLLIEFDANGNVVNIADESDVIPVVGDGPRDAGVAMLEDSVIAFTDQLATRIIARTEVALDGLRANVRTQETNQGNLIADAFLWWIDNRTDDFGNIDRSLPVIAMQNGGGIRNDEVIPAGSDISELKTFDILPFSNFVSLIGPVTPQQVKDALENSVSRVENRNGRFSQIAGFEIVYDPDGVADESRIISARLDDGTFLVRNGQANDNAPDVYIATNSFAARGGDGYDEFAAAGFINVGPSYQRALFDYLVADNGADGVVTAAEYPAGGEGRIRVLDDIFGAGLRILHNNDGESKLVADTLDSGVAFGGAARFAAIVDSLRDEGLPTVMLSSGDNILPGTTFNASLAREDRRPLYDSEVINAIGYDALAIGNHDFDFGPDILQRLIQQTGAPFLSANLNFDNEPGLQNLVRAGRIAPSVVLDVDGTRLGVIGLTTPRLPTISSPRGVTVDPDLMSAVQNEVDMLTARGVNRIVLVSHLQNIDEEIMLAADLTGVDVIIAGGGDELLTNDLANELGGLERDTVYPLPVLDAADETVYLVTTPGEYRFVGNLLIDFDDDGSVLRVREESDVIPVLGDGDRDTTIAMLEDSILAFGEVLANNVIARTEVDLDGLRASVRTMETNQGNLITDAYLWYYERNRADFGFDADIPVIAVQNGGGIRDDEVIPAGSDITELKTFDILPFSNFVTVLDPISPTALLSALENSFSGFPAAEGRFLQIAGFEVVFDMSAPANSRIVRVTLDDGTPIIDGGMVVAGAPSVYVVTNSFTAAGGDGYDEFENLTATNIGPSYQRVLFEYLEAADGLNGLITADDYPAGGEGRILDITVGTSFLDLRDYGWEMMPNPFVNAFTVNFAMPEAGEVRIDLFDATGRPLSAVMEQTVPAGAQSVMIHGEGLVAGMYFLRVRINDRVGVARIVKH